MPYFKDQSGGLHFLDDAAFSDFLPSGSVQITDADADTMRATTQQDLIASYTVEQTIALYEAALDAHLDAAAKADRWRDRFTFAVRAGYENPWQAKAKAFGTWMDNCNAQAYALIAAVTAGTATLPTVDDFIADLPPFVAP